MLLSAKLGDKFAKPISFLDSKDVWLSVDIDRAIGEFLINQRSSSARFVGSLMLSSA